MHLSGIFAVGGSNPRHATLAPPAAALKILAEQDSNRRLHICHYYHTILPLDR